MKDTIEKTKDDLDEEDGKEVIFKVSKDVPASGESVEEGDIPIPLESSHDSYILNNRFMNTNAVTSLFHKKITEELYEKIDREKIKCSQEYYIDLLKVGRYILIQDYMGTFGDIITINYQFGILEYKECYVVFHNPDGAYITGINVYIYSNNFDNVQNTLEDLKKHLNNLTPDKIMPNIGFTWFAFLNGRIEPLYQSECMDDEFHTEAYPYLGDVNELIQDYINIDIPILFLRGSPGTGKTRLIREILKQLYYKLDRQGLDCIYTSSKEVIENGSIFLKLIFQNADVLILEDIDYHLTPRKDGNTSLYSLLSVSNGIMANSMKNKKIILSSNLPNVKNVDDALIRPGRCYDILDMKALTPNQADIIFKILGKKRIFEQKTYTLADIYNS